MGKIHTIEIGTNGTNNNAFEGDPDIEEVHVQPDGTQISKLVFL
jgi:hypothetical protein